MKKTAVYIIDDHPVIRHGVRSVLNKTTDIEVIGESRGAKSAMEQFKTLVPDVIILDITLEGISGIDLIPRIKEKLEDVLIVIYSMHENPNQIYRAIKAGAKGYVLKGDEIKDLITAIRNVLQDKLYVSSGLSPKIIQQVLSGKTDQGSLSMLTPREYEIANLLVQGMNPDEIGETLFISPKTVRVHRTNIMHKLGCQRVNELLLSLADHFPRSH